MITRSFNRVPKRYFKEMITRMVLAGQDPQLEQSNTEVNLWYNHPELPKRMCHRMGMFKTRHYCSEYLEELSDIIELVRKENGL